MRRIVVTGLGAVTPIGNDARTTWESAVAGRSGIDFIRSYEPNGQAVRIAAEVKDFDPSAVVSHKEARKLDRNVLLAVAAAKEAVGDADLDGAYDAGRVGILFGTAIGGFLGIMEQAEVMRERGPDRVAPTFIPSVLVDAIELERPVVSPALQDLREEAFDAAARAGHRRIEEHESRLMLGVGSRGGNGSTSFVRGAFAG